MASAVLHLSASELCSMGSADFCHSSLTSPRWSPPTHKLSTTTTSATTGGLWGGSSNLDVWTSQRTSSSCSSTPQCGGLSCRRTARCLMLLRNHTFCDILVVPCKSCSRHFDRCIANTARKLQSCSVICCVARTCLPSLCKKLYSPLCFRNNGRDVQLGRFLDERSRWQLPFREASGGTST